MSGILITTHSARIEVRIDPDAALKIRSAIARGFVKWAEFDLVPEIKKLSPIKFGKNRDSVTYKTDGSFEGGTMEQQVLEVFTESGYGGWLEVGTGIYGPHQAPIVPKSGKALSWLGVPGEPGTRRFAKWVRGRPATPYMYPALESTKAKLPGRIREEIDAMGATA